MAWTPAGATTPKRPRCEDGFEDVWWCVASCILHLEPWLPLVSSKLITSYVGLLCIEGFSNRLILITSFELDVYSGGPRMEIGIGEGTAGHILFGLRVIAMALWTE